METGKSTEHKVIIALGTNFDHEKNMEHATWCLSKIMSGMKYSRRLWTEPVGLMSGKFLNQLVVGTCSFTEEELHNETKRIERECGRCEEEKNAGIVRIDIDILKYDEKTEHTEDWNREYIKLLIKEL